jgi:hypothetical protein
LTKWQQITRTIASTRPDSSSIIVKVAKDWLKELDVNGDISALQEVKVRLPTIEKPAMYFENFEAIVTADYKIRQKLVIFSLWKDSSDIDSQVYVNSLQIMVRSAQTQSVEVKHYVNFLKSGIVPDFTTKSKMEKICRVKGLALTSDGYLCRRYRHESDGKIDEQFFVRTVERPLQMFIAFKFHRSTFTNVVHPGVTRSLLLIQKQFYWKGMRNTVKSIINGCNSCQQFGYTNHSQNYPSEVMRHPTRPWAEVGVVRIHLSMPMTPDSQS